MKFYVRGEGCRVPGRYKKIAYERCRDLTDNHGGSGNYACVLSVQNRFLDPSMDTLRYSRAHITIDDLGAKKKAIGGITLPVSDDELEELEA